MVDDIEDSSEKRRGDLCTYKKFGIDYAINTGNYMYFQHINQMQNYIDDKNKHADLYKIFIEESTNIHLGQNWDIHWHNQNDKVPTEKQYYHMVQNKTSVLLRLCLRFIATLNGQSPEQ